MTVKKFMKYSRNRYGEFNEPYDFYMNPERGWLMEVTWKSARYKTKTIIEVNKNGYELYLKNSEVTLITILEFGYFSEKEES